MGYHRSKTSCPSLRKVSPVSEDYLSLAKQIITVSSGVTPLFDDLLNLGNAVDIKQGLFAVKPSSFTMVDLPLRSGKPHYTLSFIFYILILH